MAASDPVIDTWPPGPHTQTDCLNSRTTAENNVQDWKSDTTKQLQASALAVAFRIEDLAEERKKAYKNALDAEINQIDLKYGLWMLDIYIIEASCNLLPKQTSKPCSIAVEGAKELAEDIRKKDTDTAEKKYKESVEAVNDLRDLQLKRNSERFQQAVKRLRYRAKYFEILINKAYENCRNSAHQ